MTTKPSAASLDPAEIAKFSAMAEEWWNQEGKFKPLHRLNPVRVGYIRNIVGRQKTEDGGQNNTPLSGITLLDIGCGGGLLAEPMTRLGAQVTAIDASEKNISIASLHAEKMGLSIDYRCTTAEQLAAEGKQFDVVLNMEVIEHVADVASFLNACQQLLKPGGTMFIATLNRTVKSYLFAILGAEYVMRWLPRGTHHWNKFLLPSEIEVHLRQHGLKLEEIKGVTYNPFQDSFALSNDLSVNYMMMVRKPIK